jgi:hypothetical protein
MKADNDSRRLLTRGLGVVGAIAGTTAAVASTTSPAVASVPTGPTDGVSGGVTTSTTIGAATPSGAFESCTAMFGLAHKNDASWVRFDVHANQPVTPAVTIGPELQAVVTVHGAPSEADVECEADVATWTSVAEWLDYVRVQRDVPDLTTITGRYPYPGGPGYAIPVVDRSYAPGVTNHLTAPITVSGASVRFVANSTRFSVVGGSPQDLHNLAPSSGAAAARAQVLAIDPSFDATVTLCQTLPSTATSGAITTAVAALGSVWGIDVDAVFPPASPSIDDRCTALNDAQSYYFATATKSLTVGTMATVTIEPATPPTTATTSTTVAPPPAAAAVVTPAFTG